MVTPLASVTVTGRSSRLLVNHKNRPLSFPFLLSSYKMLQDLRHDHEVAWLNPRLEEILAIQLGVRAKQW